MVSSGCCEGARRRSGQPLAGYQQLEWLARIEPDSGTDRRIIPGVQHLDIPLSIGRPKKGAGFQAEAAAT
jgi:hypothetical protein